MARSEKSGRAFLFLLPGIVTSADYKDGASRRRDAQMPTRVAIDGRLILEARELVHDRTAKDAVTAALGEYIRRREQADILRLFGTIDYDDRYEYKRERTRKRK